MLFLKADNSPEHKLLSDTTKKARALRIFIKNKTRVAISFFFHVFGIKLGRKSEDCFPDFG